MDEWTNSRKLVTTLFAFMFMLVCALGRIPKKIFGQENRHPVTGDEHFEAVMSYICSDSRGPWILLFSPDANQ